MGKAANLKTWLVMMVLVLGIYCTTAAGDIIYVDADTPDNNDGSNWANAFKYLQDALADANSNPDVNEIWVAQSTYKPDANSTNPDGSGDRTATFQLISSMTIYGGYAGFAEPDPNARDIELYETILSGDLDGNDVQVDPCDLLDEPTRAENSYHVVIGSGTDATAVLDGFTITAGNANSDDWPHFFGGGMFNERGSPTVTNCTFSGNSAGSYGGGMGNGDNSSPTLTNCMFSENTAREDGGGVCNFYNCSPAVINCMFSGNSAGRGGGMYNRWNCSPTVINCMFSGNSAVRGGGMCNSESSPTLTNCIFTGNSASTGGGMYNYLFSGPTLTNCIFSENTAAEGGGMGNNMSNPTLTNCIFSGNSADYRGGGMLNWDSSPTLTNCTFSDNSAGSSGGGMFNGKSSPTLTNCTFSGNSADYRGGGMYNVDSSPTITNCILWGDTAASDGNEIAVVKSATIDVNYCDVKGGQAGIYNDGTSTVNWGSGNINADPMFFDANNPDPNLRDYHLRPGSPCIDAGDNNSIPADTTDLDNDGNTVEPIPWDLDANPRIVDGNDDGIAVVDMGAYEFSLSDPVELLYVLVDDVIDFVQHEGIENSLLVKLDTALQKLEDGNENNDGAAINSLQAFINAVEAQRGKKISQEDADDLITAAQQVIEMLSSE